MPNILIEKISSFKKDRSAMLIAFKLLHDSFFLLLIFFAMALISEGVLPGVIISQISLSTILILATLNFLAIIFLASAETLRNYKIKPTSGITARNTYLLFFFLAILIFNSQFKINIFLNLFILLIALAIAYLIYRIIFEGEKK